MSWEISELPFPMGQTAALGLDTVDPALLANLEGMEWIVRDGGQESNRDDQGTGRLRRVRLVKNNSGGVLLAKKCVTLTNFGRYAGGYAVALNDYAYPVDPYLPGAGVADQDHFYVITAGPAVVRTASAGDAGNVLALGDRVGVAAADAGRVRLVDYSGAAAVLAQAIMNTLGYAGSAKTTNNTDADLLVDVRWR